MVPENKTPVTLLILCVFTLSTQIVIEKCLNFDIFRAIAGRKVKAIADTVCFLKNYIF